MLLKRLNSPSPKIKISVDVHNKIVFINKKIESLILMRNKEME